MKQPVPMATYQLVRATFPAGPMPGGQQMQPFLQFEAPLGMRLHSVIVVKETTMIGANHQAVLVLEGVQNVLVDMPDPTPAPADEQGGAPLPDISALTPAGNS